MIKKKQANRCAISAINGKINPPGEEGGTEWRSLSVFTNPVTGIFLQHGIVFKGIVFKGLETASRFFRNSHGSNGRKKIYPSGLRSGLTFLSTGPCQEKYLKYSAGN